MQKAVGFTAQKQLDLLPLSKRSEMMFGKTEMESNPQVWIKVETQIILWFNFQGFKILIDGCVCIFVYEYLAQNAKLCSCILELTLLYLVEITAWLSSSGCMKARFLQRVFRE